VTEAPGGATTVTPQELDAAIAALKRELAEALTPDVDAHPTVPLTASWLRDRLARLAQ
jgi:hypothetical protein